MKSLKFLGLFFCLVFLFSLNSFAKEKVEVTGQLNINKASVDELTKIPGIGKSKAKAIVEFRENNPFNSKEDLLKVKGISKKLLAKIEAYIKLSGESDLMVTKLAKTSKAKTKKSE